MKKYILVSLVAGVVLTAFTFTACANKSGSLPTLSVGDKWVTKGIAPFLVSSTTLEVTGEEVIESKDLYVMRQTTELDTGGGPFTTLSGVMKVDKSTGEMVSIQNSLLSGEGVWAMTLSYEFPGAHRFPLKVGKEYKVVMTSTSNLSGRTVVETENLTYRVETIENMTVAAGTFRCFKIVRYDEKGNTFTSWYSDEVKSMVKTVFNDELYPAELVSYSVH